MNDKLTEREVVVKKLSRSDRQPDRVAAVLMDKYDELNIEVALQRAYDILREWRDYLSGRLAEK